MNSHTKLLLFVGSNSSEFGEVGPEKELASQAVGEQNRFLAPTAPKHAKTGWNYLKFYTTIGLLLTLAGPRQGLPVRPVF